MELLVNLRRLNALILSHCHDLTDEALLEIAAIPILESLSITGANITDAGLEMMSSFPYLKELILSSCKYRMPGGLQITDEGLARMKRLNTFHTLSIQDCPEVTDTSVGLLRTLTSLKSLRLKETGMTENGYHQIMTALPSTRVDFAPTPFALEKRLAPRIAAAVKKIRERGGKVSLLDDEVWMIHLNEIKEDFKDQDLELLRPIGHVPMLTLERSSITDNGLAILSRSINVESLKLHDCRTTAEGIQALAQLPSLTELEITGIPLDDAAVLNLERLDLETLVISNCGLRDQGMQSIAALSNLSNLTIHEPLVTSAGWECLGTCVALSTLLITEMPLSEEAMKRIAQIPNITTAKFQNCEIANEGFVELSKMKKLQHLHLSGSSATDSALQQIKTLPQIQDVALSNGQITDAGLAQLSECSVLLYLAIEKEAVTDRGLREVAKLANLRMLTLSGTRITDEGIAEFKKGCPSVSIFKNGDSEPAE
jgi:Leucine-rich repeat (LRR) protein